MFPTENNVGFYDQMARIVVGVFFIAVGVFGGPTMWIIGIIGLVPLITGLTGKCPAYKMMGVNTCKLG
ncbi:YgaP family membrane protein [Roseospira goensis]|uniref:Cadmium resistance protein CadD (Predicted permease) n=1 Tax=Roseospira goensis TaxID=391922 RepID=A0A7W6WJY3_9PROT|nr:DUF2892 domain-containing protein [Roseospira goensis]MBB4285164.1 cadmium resistance protein CadD (predicted permease) [Roseospira goensis]